MDRFIRGRAYLYQGIDKGMSEDNIGFIDLICSGRWVTFLKMYSNYSGIYLEGLRIII